MESGGRFLINMAERCLAGVKKRFVKPPCIFHASEGPKKGSRNVAGIAVGRPPPKDARESKRRCRRDVLSRGCYVPFTLAENSLAAERIY